MLYRRFNSKQDGLRHCARATVIFLFFIVLGMNIFVFGVGKFRIAVKGETGETVGDTGVVLLASASTATKGMSINKCKSMNRYKLRKLFFLLNFLKDF